MYVHTGKISSLFFPPFRSTQPRRVQGRQRTAYNTQRAERYNAAGHKHQQATPCMCDTPICAVLLRLVVFYRNLQSVIHHQPSAYVCCCSVGDRPTHALDGSVRIVCIENEGLNCPYIPDLLCFSAEGSSGPHHARVSGPWCTATVRLLIVALSEAAV